MKNVGEMAYRRKSDSWRLSIQFWPRYNLREACDGPLEYGGRLMLKALVVIAISRRLATILFLR